MEEYTITENQQNLILRFEQVLNNPDFTTSQMMKEIEILVDEYEMKMIADSASASFSELIENLLRKQKPEMGQGFIQTGFNDYDNTFGGLVPGELVLLAARPAMGKTQLLLNLALNISIRETVLYFSFFQDKTTLAQRLLSLKTEKENSNQENEDAPVNYLEKLIEAAKDLKSYKIIFNDTPQTHISAIKAYIKQHLEIYNAKVIIIDDLLNLVTKETPAERTMQLRFILRELKSIAKENNICIFVSTKLYARIEKRLNNKTPILSDLRENGAIEEDPDKILFLFRPEFYDIATDSYGVSSKGLAELIVAKNTSGSLGNVHLNFNPESGVYVSILNGNLQTI